MFPVLALATLAGILITAGWRNQNVIDVLLGRDSQNPHGRAPGDPVTLPDGTSVPITGAAPLAENPILGGDGPLARLGKLIGFPHQGTHTLGNWQSDNAVDISVPVGTPMLSLSDGTVVKV